MKTTRFHVFEMFYMIMVHQLLFYATMISLLFTLEPIWDMLSEVTDFSDAFFLICTISAEVVGYGAIAYGLLFKLPGTYHRTISENVFVVSIIGVATDAPFSGNPQPLCYTGPSKSHFIGAALVLAPIPIYCLLCMFTPQHQPLFATIFTSITFGGCLMGIGVIPLMLLTIRHHKNHYLYLCY